MKTHTFFLFGLLVALSGCKGIGGSGQVDENIETWEAQAPQKYVHARCETGFSIHRCTRVAVEDGVVVAAQSLNPTPGSSWVDEPDLSAVDEPVGDMFDEVQGGGSEGELESVSFDEEYGFVKSYTKSYGTEYGGYDVTCFIAGTTDLAVCGSEGEGSQGNP